MSKELKNNKEAEEFKLIDTLHIKIHALRMMPKYSPTVFEQDVNKMIAEEYASSCKECKERHERFKNQPQQQAQVKSALSGLKEVFE